MEGVTFEDTGSADPKTRDELARRYEAARRESDRLRNELRDAKLGLSSFESLFRISPFPLMEQDYTQVQRWMDEIRAEGVTDIRERLPDIEAVRNTVPLIWISAANPAAARATGRRGTDRAHRSSNSERRGLPVVDLAVRGGLEWRARDPCIVHRWPTQW